MISMENVFAWLNEFQGSSLTGPDIILRDAISQKISQGRFFEAYQAIEFLKTYENNRENAFERGEIWLECGLAYYDMGNSIEAIKSLKMAEKEFPPASHEHAVTRWMLGTVQWSFESDNAEAMVNLKEAIEEFRSLEKMSEQDRRVREKDWYADRIEDMEENLRERISEKFTS